MESSDNELQKHEHDTEDESPQEFNEEIQLERKETEKKENKEQVSPPFNEQETDITITNKSPKSQPIKTISYIINQYISLYQKIETLENEIQQFTIKKRRRICNLFDIHPLYRRSHLRLFFSHELLQNNMLVDNSVNDVRQWKLLLEGTLIVGYDESTNSSSTTASSTTDNVGDSTTNMDGIDEQQQASIKKPILFTHFFEKIEVTFRPFVPPPTKKSSSKRRKLNDTISEVDTSSGKNTKLVWTRGEGSANRTPDAHAFHAIYNDPSQKKDPSSAIVADILLYRHLPTELDLYQPSQLFMNLLLPNYYPEQRSNNPTSSSNHTHHIPCTFSFKEIVMIIYTYIQINNLQDTSDQSIIHNDRIFMELFGCKQMQLSSLKYSLFERKLITKLEDHDVPIHVQYIMNDNGEFFGAGDSKGALNSYSFDVDIYLPSPFHTQVRDILLRIKNRELAYTSARTKAVKLLTSARGDEDKIKQLLEETIHHADCTGITSALTQRKSLSSQHVLTLLALEKSSTDGSEAKIGVGIDVKLVYLMEKLLERCGRLESCWEVMEETLGVS